MGEDTTNSTLPAVFGLESARSTYRLNQIDKLRANGISEHIDLPQLVVCGDQSAGKSSVLERITGIPFPRQEGLCTRFPTEIILRHCNKPLKVTATIHPNPHRSEEEQTNLRQYKHELSDLSELSDVIRESGELIGVRGFEKESQCSEEAETDSSDERMQSGDESGQTNAFAFDVLRIEVTGPVNLYLTIVDLPGLISVSNEEQTEEDVQTVVALVESYISNPRTIIMAVVQASNDIANQRIVQLARGYDVAGNRTVGIITKPDLVNVGGEGRIARLAQNLESVKLKLGFFLVKNPSPAEMESDPSPEETARREAAFFARADWRKHGLDAARVGVPALRVFIQELLDKHIERELPKVREEVRAKLAATQAQLDDLGAERPTAGHIRWFLTNVALHFHRLVLAAKDGNYMGPDAEVFKDQQMRLRAEIHKANTSFADLMRLEGHKWHEVPNSKNPPNNQPGSGGQVKVMASDFAKWAAEVYLRTRGRELPGSYNNVLLEELFREQSSLWPKLAHRHFENVSTIVRQWVKRAIHVCTSEESTQVQILELCRARFEEAKSKAKEELERLIEDERGHPITYNHYYTDNIQKNRKDYLNAALERAIGATQQNVNVSSLSSYNISKELAVLRNAIRNDIIVDMDRQACTEALDAMKAYYKVALKTFVDNVCRQVIERHIMKSLTEFFGPSTVAMMSEEELTRIAGEPADRAAKRLRLQGLLAGFKQSLIDLKSL